MVKINLTRVKERFWERDLQVVIIFCFTVNSAEKKVKSLFSFYCSGFKPNVCFFWAQVFILKKCKNSQEFY